MNENFYVPVSPGLQSLVLAVFGPPSLRERENVRDLGVFAGQTQMQQYAFP